MPPIARGRGEASTSTEKPWKGKPTTKDNYINDSGELEPLDAANFSAAGALLWRGDKALLAVEERDGRGLRNFLGGKRDTVDETARVVAARECWEETGELLSDEARNSLAATGRPVVWNSKSKYALFLHELGDADANIAGSVASVHDPDLRVEWVELSSLIDDNWCRAKLHSFAVEQARTARPAIARLVERMMNGTTNALVDALCNFH